MRVSPGGSWTLATLPDPGADAGGIGKGTPGDPARDAR